MPKLKPWHQISSKTILETNWIKLESQSYKLPDGTKLNDYHVLEEKDAVETLAVTPDKQILIVRQFRPAANGFVYDLGGGLLEEDKDLIEHAQTELLEETGDQSDNWHYVGLIHPAPQRMKKIEHVVLALDVSKIQEPNQDDTEEVESLKVPISKLEDMIISNEFFCGICIAAYFKCKLYCQVNNIELFD